MKPTYFNIALQALTELNRPATASEIWQYIEQNQLYQQLPFYDAQQGVSSLGKTPWSTVGAHLYERAKKADSPITTQGNRPKYFVLKATAQPVIAPSIAAPSVATPKTHFHERDLHPLLCKFLYSSPTFSALSYTIFHERSKKNQKGADAWLHPDMVAVNFEYADFENEALLNFIKKFDRLPLKLFSFELKIRLDFGNYKECFFQAVSNSSWANEGYLVALDMAQDEGFVDALQKLSQSFGIGIIHLDAQNIAQSQILSPAQFKEKIDYTTAYELAEKNSDFAKFLKNIVEYDPYNGYRFTGDFDEVLDDDELVKYLHEKKILR